MLKTVRRQLLYVDHIRGAIAYIRYVYFAKILRRLRTIEAGDANWLRLSTICEGFYQH